MLLPKYDPLDPAVMADPYPLYARLRQAGPVCRGGPGQWVVPRYAEVAALLHDPRLAHEFSDDLRQFSMGEGPVSLFFRRIILNRDPPGHTRLRRMMGAAFGSSHKLSNTIRTAVDELLAPLLDGAEFDAVRDIAWPLPVTVVCELIGVPAADRHRVRPYATDLAKAFGTRIPEAERVAANAALVWLRSYIGALLEERRKAPRPDLLSAMAQTAEPGDDQAFDEMVDNAVFLFFAGFETTMNLIGTGCAALLEWPDQLARLRKDDALIPRAVEEFLRYDAPIQSAGRQLLAPLEIGGRWLKPGRVLILLLGSANRDEREFDRPDRLDLGREHNPHVSFGGGAHYCLGASLARLEVAVFLRRLLERFSVLEAAGEPIRRVSSGFRSYASVPIRANPA